MQLIKVLLTCGFDLVSLDISCFSVSVHRKLALFATHQHVENSESTQVKHTLTEVPHVESRHEAKVMSVCATAVALSVKCQLGTTR